MIIVCPECSDPFEVREGDIAELLQVACPHCGFRMILDFAAANDPSLVESGMAMASGYRSAAHYRAHDAAAAPRRLQPVAQAPGESEGPAAPPPTQRPSAAPLSEPRTQRASTLSPGTGPRPQAPTSRPVTQPRTAQASADVPARTGETAVGRYPDAPDPPNPVAGYGDIPVPDFDDEEPTEIRHSEHDYGAIMPPPMAETGAVPVVDPAVAFAPQAAALGAREPAFVPPPSAVPTALDRVPQHTPPRPAHTKGQESSPAPVERDDAARYEPRRASPFGTFVLALLVVLAVALVGASMVLHGSPDPRPLLEDLYRGYFK